MIYDCPDTIKLYGPSELLNRDCTYSMYDCSLMRKHRVRARGYVPCWRASSKDTWTFGFVFSVTPPSCAVTSNATSSETAVNGSKLRYDWGAIKSEYIFH